MDDIIKPSTASNDIKVAAANLNGKDYLIGDLHGNSRVLDAALNKLSGNDRLMLLGDLTDRGRDSPGVIKIINNVNRDNPGTILAIRGNHETLTLNAIAALETMTDIIDTFKTMADINAFIEKVKTSDHATLLEHYGEAGLHLNNHLQNGGDWLVKLFTREYLEDRIQVNDEANTIGYTKNSDVYLIKKYMNSLPYIYHVEGAPGIIPYQSVHADMPLDEAEIIKRARAGTGLTEDEKDYAGWARPNEGIVMAKKGRFPTSPVGFVGHNIVDNVENTPLRFNSNTVDLDIGSYANNIAALFCITDGTCEFVGDGVEDAMKDPRMVEILHQYKSKGLQIQALNTMSYRLAHCQSTQEIMDVLSSTAEFFKSLKTFPETLKHSYESLREFSHKNGMLTDKNIIDLAQLEVLQKIQYTASHDRARLPTDLQTWANALGQDVNSLIDFAVKNEVLTPGQARWCRWSQPKKDAAPTLFEKSKDDVREVPPVRPISPRKAG